VSGTCCRVLAVIWSARLRLVRCWRVHHGYRDLEVGRHFDMSAPPCHTIRAQFSEHASRTTMAFMAALPSAAAVRKPDNERPHVWECRSVGSTRVATPLGGFDPGELLLVLYAIYSCHSTNRRHLATERWTFVCRYTKKRGQYSSFTTGVCYHISWPPEPRHPDEANRTSLLPAAQPTQGKGSDQTFINVSKLLLLCPSF